MSSMYRYERPERTHRQMSDKAHAWFGGIFAGTGLLMLVGLVVVLIWFTG